MDIFLKQYGESSFQRKDFDNLYSYIEILNYEFNLYLERKRINLASVYSLMDYSNIFLLNFKKYFYELSEQDLKNMPELLKESYRIIEDLKRDNFYEPEDEYFIFKYVDFIYNVKYLFNFFVEQEKVLYYYKKLEDDMVTPLYVNLNTDEPITEQLFYNPQILNSEQREYFLKELENNNIEFKEILKSDLEETVTFPTPNFFLYGIYLDVNKVLEQYSELANFLEEVPEPAKKDLSISSKFSKYNSVRKYTTRLLRERNFSFLLDINKYKENPLYLWLMYNLTFNILLPKAFFSAIKQEIFKEDYPADSTIKFYLLNLLGLGEVLEANFFMRIMIFTDEIFNTNMDNLLEEFNRATKKEDNPDLIAGLLFDMLLDNKIDLKEVEKHIPKDQFEEILVKNNLLEVSLDKFLPLYKNGLIRFDRKKVENFNRVKIKNSKNLSQTMDFVSKITPRLPIDSYSPELNTQDKLRNEIEKENKNKLILETIKNNTTLDKDGKINPSLSPIPARNDTIRKLQLQKDNKLRHNKKPNDIIGKYAGDLVKRSLEQQVDVAKTLAKAPHTIPLLTDTDNGAELASNANNMRNFDKSKLDNIPPEGSTILPDNIKQNKDGFLENKGKPVLQKADPYGAISDSNINDNFDPDLDKMSAKPVSSYNKPASDIVGFVPLDSQNPENSPANFGMLIDPSSFNGNPDNTTSDMLNPNVVGDFPTNSNPGLSDEEAEKLGQNIPDTDIKRSTPDTSLPSNPYSTYMDNWSDSIGNWFNNRDKGLERYTLNSSKKPLNYVENTDNKVKDWIDKNIGNKVRDLTDGVNAHLRDLNGKVQAGIDTLSSYLNNAKDLIASTLNGVMGLLDTLMKSLCNYLCLVGMALNAGDTIKDTINNFLKATKDLLDSALDEISDAVDQGSKVLDDILGAFGLDNQLPGGACNKAGQNSFLDNLKKELNDFAKEQANNILNNLKDGVEKSLKCKASGFKFQFGALSGLTFGFKIGGIMFEIPKC